MARTLSGITPLVGHVVYKPFEPQRPGKIIEVVKESSWRAVVKVRWLKDRSVSVEEGALNSFDALVEDTERKAKKHRETLERARREL